MKMYSNCSPASRLYQHDAHDDAQIVVDFAVACMDTRVGLQTIFPTMHNCAMKIFVNAEVLSKLAEEFDFFYIQDAAIRLITSQVFVSKKGLSRDEFFFTHTADVIVLPAQIIRLVDKIDVTTHRLRNWKCTRLPCVGVSIHKEAIDRSAFRQLFEMMGLVYNFGFHLVAMRQTLAELRPLDLVFYDEIVRKKNVGQMQVTIPSATGPLVDLQYAPFDILHTKRLRYLLISELPPPDDHNLKRLASVALSRGCIIEHLEHCHWLLSSKKQGPPRISPISLGADLITSTSTGRSWGVTGSSSTSTTAGFP
jgi:hypothetical protein